MCGTLSCIALGSLAVHTSAGSVRCVSTSITEWRSNSSAERVELMGEWSLSGRSGEVGSVRRSRVGQAKSGRSGEGGGSADRACCDQCIDLGGGATDALQHCDVVLAERRRGSV